MRNRDSGAGAPNQLKSDQLQENEASGRLGPYDAFYSYKYDDGNDDHRLTPEVKAYLREPPANTPGVFLWARVGPIAELERQKRGRENDVDTGWGPRWIQIRTGGRS